MGDDVQSRMTLERLSLRHEVMAVLLLFGGLATIIALDAAGASLLAIPRAILSLLAVLVAPGYFWQAALFPRQASLDAPERSALVAGLSAASIPLLTIVLDGLLQVPLQVDFVLLSVAVWTGLGLVASAIRRHAIPPEERFLPRLPVAGLRQSLREDRMGAVLIGSLVFIAIIGALALVLTFAATGPGTRFTEFYVLGGEGLAEGYPRALRVGSPTLLTTTIVNDDHQAQHFTVVGRIGGQVVGQSESFTVEPGSSVDVVLSVTPLVSDRGVTLDLSLVRDSDAEVYRTLRLWVDVLPDDD